MVHIRGCWFVAAGVALPMAACVVPEGETGERASALSQPRHKDKKCKEHKYKDKSHGDCQKTSATIGTSGGTLTTADGLTMEIPFGALDGATTLTITTTDAPPPTDLGAVSPVYEFQPEGIVFSRPVKVALPLPTGVTDASIYWSRLDGPGFDEIGGEISGATISAETVHFSLAFIGAPSGSRDVVGTCVDTWISATDALVHSQGSALGDLAIEVFVGDGQGGFAPPLQGVVSADGKTFRVDDVPRDGNYILHASSSAGNHYLVTASDSPDIGRYHGGRPYPTSDAPEVVAARAALTGTSYLDIAVDGLAPWQADDGSGQRDSLEVFSSEADNWFFGAEVSAVDGAGEPMEIAHGATSARLLFDVGASMLNSFAPAVIDSTLGDHALVAQLSKLTTLNGTPYQAMSRIGELATPLVLPQDGTTTRAITLEPMAQPRTIALDFRGAEHVAVLQAEGHPRALTDCVVCGGFAGVLGQGGDARYGFFASNADLLVVQDLVGSDLATGPMSYGVPTTAGGTWGELADARWAARRLIALPDSSGATWGTGVVEALEWVTTPAELAAGPIMPKITPARAIMLNGTPFFDGDVAVGDTTNLAWLPPAIGEAAYYEIAVKRLFIRGDNRTGGALVARITTPETSFTFPPGLLDPNETYVFTLAAIGATSAEAATALASAPFKQGLDLAWAQVSSGVFGGARGVKAWMSVVQEGLAFPLGIAATEDALFWTDGYGLPADPPQGVIWTSALDGSGPQILVDRQRSPIGIAADAARVYWTNSPTWADSSLVMLDRASGAVSTLVTEPGLEAGIVAVGGGVVFASSSGINVWRSADDPIENLTPEGATRLTSDGINVYFTQYATGDGNSGRVLSVPLSGGEVTVLAEGQAQAWDVATDGSHVYWSNQAWEQPFPASIASVPVGGGESVTLTTGDEILKVFTVLEGWAYYVNAWSLMRVPLEGGAAETVGAAGGGCPEGDMVTSGRRIYWTDVCNGGVYMAELTP